MRNMKNPHAVYTKRDENVQATRVCGCRLSSGDHSILPLALALSNGISIQTIRRQTCAR
jgi:hypothetical protein